MSSLPRGFRSRGLDQSDLPGAFEARKSRFAPFLQVIELRRVGAVSRYDKGDELLAEVWVGEPDPGYVGHFGMSNEYLLHLGGVHVDATGDHHVGKAIGDIDPSAGFDPSDFAEGEDPR